MSLMEEHVQAEMDRQRGLSDRAFDKAVSLAQAQSSFQQAWATKYAMWAAIAAAAGTLIQALAALLPLFTHSR